MKKKHLVFFLPILLAGEFFVALPGASAEDLLGGLPAIPNSATLGSGDAPSGGQMARYSTSASPSAVIDAYKQAVTAAGWTVTGGGSSSHGGGFQATNGAKYLVFDAGGPQGTTYVKLCVWPTKPKNDRCDDDS